MDAYCGEDDELAFACEHIAGMRIGEAWAAHQATESQLQRLRAFCDQFEDGRRFSGHFLGEQSSERIAELAEIIEPGNASFWNDILTDGAGLLPKTSAAIQGFIVGAVGEPWNWEEHGGPVGTPRDMVDFETWVDAD